jgi:hypothetical protein
MTNGPNSSPGHPTETYFPSRGIWTPSVALQGDIFRFSEFDTEGSCRVA